MGQRVQATSPQQNMPSSGFPRLLMAFAEFPGASRMWGGGERNQELCTWANMGDPRRPPQLDGEAEAARKASASFFNGPVGDSKTWATRGKRDPTGPASEDPEEGRGKRAVRWPRRLDTQTDTRSRGRMESHFARLLSPPVTGTRTVGLSSPRSGFRKEIMPEAVNDMGSGVCVL